MANETKLENILNPQVMADMIEAKLTALCKMSPYARVNNKLMGVPGDTLNIPYWNYIGAAADVAEGDEVGYTKMTASTKTITVKKAMKCVGITQEAINSGYGNPIGAAETQLAMAIKDKLDADCFAAVLDTGAGIAVLDKSAADFGYDVIVDCVGAFDEEGMSEKVLFIPPRLVTVLRHDPNFIDKEKYGGDVMVSGEIGTVCGCRIVPSKRITVANGATSVTCPMLKLDAVSGDSEYDENEFPALTILLKKETSVDHEWFPKKQQHDVTATKYYGVAVTNAAKVLQCKFKL